MIDLEPHSDLPFYVVQFKEKKRPYKSIDKYVCVPRNWLFASMSKDLEHDTLVSYPIDEDPSITRERVENEELHQLLWGVYSVVIKYRSWSYEDACLWIEENTEGSSKISDTEPETSERSAESEPRKQLDGK